MPKFTFTPKEVKCLARKIEDNGFTLKFANRYTSYRYHGIRAKTAIRVAREKCYQGK